MKPFFARIGVIAAFLLLGCNAKKASLPKPNIVRILIDNLGYGDVGCYGNTTNLTPNIDRLAKEGMQRQCSANGTSPKIAESEFVTCSC